MSEQFANAQQLALFHPTSFEAPTELELSVLKKGGFVKICSNDERFWMQLTEINWRMFKSAVNNVLVQNDLEVGEEVQFHIRNIIYYLIV